MQAIQKDAFSSLLLFVTVGQKPGVDLENIFNTRILQINYEI